MLAIDLLLFHVLLADHFELTSFHGLDGVADDVSLHLAQTFKSTVYSVAFDVFLIKLLCDSIFIYVNLVTNVENLVLGSLAQNEDILIISARSVLVLLILLLVLEVIRAVTEDQDGHLAF